MYSFNFPEMLRSNTSILVEDKEAVKSNIILLLNSERKTLFGDPYYGTALKQVLFEQSNTIIVDLIIDELYMSLQTFIPQIFLERKQIEIFTDGTDMFAKIAYTYILDNTSDMFAIKLTESE